MSRGLVAVLVGAAMLAVPLPAGAEPAVCTWGGHAAAPTGEFSIGPVGLSNAHPSTQPLQLLATGAVEGASARCAGTLTFDATILPGSYCRAFVLHGSFTGLDGLAWGIEAGNAWGHGTGYGPDGSVAGLWGASILSEEAPDVVTSCLTPEGVSEGHFWATLELIV